VTTPILNTKLYNPPTRQKFVPRPRLIERLNEGSNRKLTLISAPAGFGKSTLVSEWIANCELPAAWLSLDEGDNDLTRFLTYIIAALQTIESDIGQGTLGFLQSPGPINVEIVLTTLLNEITEISGDLVLFLDDYHVIESQPIDKAITFLLNHQPTKMHLIIASRIDPSLPLSRLRANGEMTELRADDLRFTPNEVSDFLNRVMGFDLAIQDISALETRTEGWIAGLQLAALSMKGLKGNDEIIDFINSFTGSDRYIQDYLADEVLRQRPKGTRDFLLQTSILKRLSAPLCDTVRFSEAEDSQAILEDLEATNLFIVPLDNERRWYRYHHLFADLLLQRLEQEQSDIVEKLHIRASAWYEKNNLEIEAFQHAAAANDFDRAARLIEGGGLPLQYLGATLALNWLASLPSVMLNSRPSLWVTYASALNFSGQTANAEQKLQAAEEALKCYKQDAGADEETNDIIGHIAAIRSMIGVGQHDLDTIIVQSRRALEHLAPNNLQVRTIAGWTLGYAYQLQGDITAASQAYNEVLNISPASGDIISTLAATTGLGNIQESENQLFQAAESYRRGEQLFRDRPEPVACGVYLGLARIYYEWNELDSSQHYAQLSLQLSLRLGSIDTPALCWVLLSRLRLAQGDVAAADCLLTKAELFVRQRNFMHRMPEVAAAQVLQLLHQGDLATAAQLAEKHDLPTSQARVNLAQGDTSTAMEMLDSIREQVEAESGKDEILKTMVLQAIALQMHGEIDRAIGILGDVLIMAEPGGFIRIFIDEGAPMAQLLQEAAQSGIKPEYTNKLLAAFEVRIQDDTAVATQQLIDPLTQRELEVLRLIAEDLSNREIGERLYLALDTVKGHNRKIFAKLGVKNRTQAVYKAISLKILPPQ
jgi:LuxR family maltose regulon positive regulatory protein